MARPEYLESPMSSRSRRSSRVLPPAPMVDSLESEDEHPDSPPHRSSRGRGRGRARGGDDEMMPRGRLVLRERERERELDRQDEILMQTPDSRASSSSHRPSRRYQSDPRAYTPPHSVSSSRASTRVPHPPMTSMTRPSTAEAPYRRPSLRELAPPGYDEPESRHAVPRTHSQSRSVHAVPSAPVLRGRRYPSGTESNDEDTETTYDSRDVRRRLRGGEPPRRLSLDDRSPSRAEPRTSHHRSRRRRGDPARLDEDYDEMDSRHTLSVDLEPPPAPLPRSRPRSRTPSARPPIPEPDVTESEDSQDGDRLRDRFDRRGKHRHRRHGSHRTDPRRRHSESHMDSSPTPKRYVLSSIFGGTPGSSHRARPSPRRYYESEVTTVEKLDRHHPPSASVRRSNTVSGSQAAASQHHSVSSTRRSSSSTFLGSFFGSSLHSHHHHATDKRVKVVECVVCRDDLPSRKTAKLKCGHRMCHSCLKRSFKLSITDPQHMPPKCCTAATIPLKHVDRLFDNDFKRTWNKKFVEYSTRNRIYCPKKGCNEFIRPEDIRHADDGQKYGKCDKCRTKVCVRCNGRWHSGRDCPKDEETLRFMAQAKDEGWQRCFRCKAVVELKEGCNHMTCRCGAEFCMICGARWRTCDCSWFNYDPSEDDRLDHMQIPLPVRDRFGVRPAVEMPPSPTRHGRPGPGMTAFPGPRMRPQHYDDEAYARRLQSYQESEGGPEDDFLGGFGDIHGLGNAAGHHMNDNFRPRPRQLAVPEPPQPSPLPPMTLDSAPGFDRAAPGDYVLDVNRARGVRAASLGRLADRFNTDLRQGPVHRPPPLPTAATMPLPTMVSAMSPGHVSVPTRRYTVESGDVYDDERSRPRSGVTRSTERVAMGGRTARPVFHEEPEDMVTHGVHPMKQHIRDPPKASNLAGLTGPGRGADRVFEWRTHVEPGDLGPGPDASG